jgi:hypothetical protein
MHCPHRSSVLSRLLIDSKNNQISPKNLVFTYVWLTTEPNVGANRLDQLPDSQIFVAEQKRECVDFLSTISPLDKIIFIVNEQLVRNVVDLIHHQCAIKVIFVIRSSMNNTEFDEWAKSYVKVRTFF